MTKENPPRVGTTAGAEKRKSDNDANSAPDRSRHAISKEIARAATGPLGGGSAPAERRTAGNGPRGAFVPPSNAARPDPDPERGAAVPPGFGAGKPWRLRTVSWLERDPNGGTEPVEYAVLVKRGMPVHDQLHRAYWDSRDACARLIATCREAGQPQPLDYALVDRDDRVVGVGVLEEGDDADAMAWLACMFMEMKALRMAVSLPGGAS